MTGPLVSAIVPRPLPQDQLSRDTFAKRFRCRFSAKQGAGGRQHDLLLLGGTRDAQQIRQVDADIAMQGLWANV
jgi:hypothetical protein